MSEQRYKMKDGARVYCSLLGLVLTSKNCTDNNARILLGSTPSAKGQFDELPKDYEKECKEALEAFKAGKEYNPGGGSPKPTKKEIKAAEEAVKSAKTAFDDAEKILSGRKESMEKLASEAEGLEGEEKEEKQKLIDAFAPEVESAEKELADCKEKLETATAALEALVK